MKTTPKIIAASALAAVFLVFCKKEVSAPQTLPTPYYVRMTDAPAAYQQVNVDVQGVELTGHGKTITLNVTPGIYNLLDYANGADTLIATGSVNIEKVQQVRLILGSNNTVMADSVVHPLTIPGGSETGLKIQVHQSLLPGVAYELLLDFDAFQSVVEHGNGKYHLKPVIRAVDNAISGSITGTLSATGVSAVITATGSAGGFSTIADTISGGFIIKAVPAGAYTVNVVPAAPHTSVSIGNVNVATGAPTSVGTVSI